MIPSRLLPQVATLIQAGQAIDEYGDPTPDYGTGATRQDIRVRLSQTTARENNDNRAAQISEWHLVTNHLDLSGADRLEWNDTLFEIVGPPALPPDWTGHPHHAEATVRVVTG